jgi:hypothetical protein
MENRIQSTGQCIMDVDSVMTDQQRLLVHVRTVLCGTECFSAYEVDTLVRRFKCGVSASQDSRMTTWVPENTVSVLIAGTTMLGNVVIMCRSGHAYTMSHGLQIPPLAPGVVLVGNCALNYDHTFRLLIYDGDNLPGGDGTKEGPQSTTERYERLRNFFPQYFEGSESARNTFVLQWLGHYEHAVKFLSGTIDVGHKIGGLVSTTSDAMNPTRPVRVQIPNVVIQRFQEKK